MSAPTFLRGVALALALALGAAVFMDGVATVFGAKSALRLIVTGLGLVYIGYLAASATRRTGIVTTLLFWAVATAAAWFVAPSIAVYALLQVAMIWLARSVLERRRPLAALADLSINAAAVLLATAAMTRTGSLFLTVWSFFLVQALHVAIPRFTRSGRPVPRPDLESEFDAARQRATTAIDQLVNRTPRY